MEDNETSHSVLYIALGVLCQLKVQAENRKINAMKSILFYVIALWCGEVLKKAGILCTVCAVIFNYSECTED